VIVEKHFYTIGDVSRMTKVKPHILRYWESQFKVIRPARRYSGHRKYTVQEIDLINKIRYLIIDRKFTLSGAIKEINRQINRKGTSGTPEQDASADVRKTLMEIKKDVDECLQLMND
jgi:DNA-binding transcriptional MerR regulator